MMALDRFDPDRARLSTYSRFWIRAELLNYLKGAPIVKGAPSLGEPVSTRQDALTCDPDDQQEVLTEAGEIGHLRDQLDAAMDATLDHRERVIFEAQYLADPRTTLDDLGAQFGISRERARQIRQAALKKVENAAKSAPEIRRSREKRRRLMAEFYASTTPRHHRLDEWLDAIGRRFPEAVMADRIAAHRLAEALTEEILRHREPHHHRLSQSDNVVPLRRWRKPSCPVLATLDALAGSLTNRGAEAA
jgi:RNA polymerase sigma factor (sigma-70 family)